MAQLFNTLLGMRPRTGLALAVLLREHVDHSNKDQLTAFALHSGHLDLVRGRLPSTAGPHVIARLNNIEWVFAKDEEARWSQIVALAEGVRQLPRTWPEDDYEGAEIEALKLLRLNEDVNWYDRAKKTVRESQPPIHDLSGGAHGLLFVRWLLHQILPFPCFLWREEWVAARLRVTLDCFRALVKQGGRLSAELKSMSYQGMLRGFTGDRWWRAALEEYVWEVTNGRPVDIDVLHGALRERTAVTLEPLDVDAAIVCLGSDFEPTGEIIRPDYAVRIRPDQWPPFADDAWTSVAQASEDPLLRAVVDPLDVERLEIRRS